MKHFLNSAAVASIRFLLAAWVGAAALFVITSVAEQTSPAFDSVTRDQLATVRFPLYYRFGFAAVIAAMGSCVIAFVTADGKERRKWLVVGIIAGLSGVLMLADFRMIYQPLQDLITPPGKARTPDFTRLHNASRYANQVHVGLIMFAAVISCLNVTKHPTATVTPSASENSDTKE